MEIKLEDVQKVREQFANDLSPRAEIVEHKDAKEMQSVVSEIGQSNRTAIGNGEVVEFLSMDEYKNDITNKVIHTQTTSPTTGRTFDNLFVLVKRYFNVNGKKVGERLGFINVGNMVRRSFDLTGLTPDAEGKIKGARRVVIPGTFNEKLASFRIPWEMLSQCLAGKKVTGKLSTDKLWFQEFVNRQPVPDKYVEQQYMVYEFAK